MKITNQAELQRAREDTFLSSWGWDSGRAEGILVQKWHPDPLRRYWSDRISVLDRLLSSSSGMPFFTH